MFLFKMFVPSLECAFGGQMWFVSTIIQFYLFYPLIVKMLEIKGDFVAYQFVLGYIYGINRVGRRENLE